MSKSSFLLTLALCSIAGLFRLQAQSPANTSSNDLFEQLIKSKGYQSTIVFDASNIKQYWVDPSVMSKDNTIYILFSQNSNHSIPYKIQLANVLENQKCRIDLITNTSDCSFSVSNSNLKTISTSSIDSQFIQSFVLSSSFNIEETKDYSFYFSNCSLNRHKILYSAFLLEYYRIVIFIFHCTAYTHQTPTMPRYGPVTMRPLPSWC